jgi:electron transfer flavoprotein beta subunit
MAKQIVVCLKQVPDNTKLRPETITDMPTHGVDMMMNPFDEYALETALRLKESAGDGSTVTLLTLGHESAKNVMKKAVAAGADAGFIVDGTDVPTGDGLATATVLAKAIQALTPDARIVVCGTSALDVSGGMVPAMMAEKLGWASLTQCKEVALEGDALTAKRVSELGVETHELSGNAVLAMMKCDYELRSSNIKGVMKANKTQLPVKTLADIGATVVSGIATKQLAQRPEKGDGKVIEASNGTTDAAVDELVSFLKAQKLV